MKLVSSNISSCRSRFHNTIIVSPSDSEYVVYYNFNNGIYVAYRIENGIRAERLTELSYEHLLDHFDKHGFKLKLNTYDWGKDQEEPKL
jgi:hypothetical protein